MAIMTDPDDLVDGVSIVINTTTSKIQLLEAGLLTSDGVTIKCVYSKIKELWMSNDSYIQYLFPMDPLTDEQFHMVRGWDWQDDATRYLLKTGGWAVKDSNDLSSHEWAGIVSLGSIASSGLPYYQQISGSGLPIQTYYSGPVNEPVLIYESGVFDYRDFFKLFVRSYGRTFSSASLTTVGASGVTYRAFRFPLITDVDAKITHSDATVSGSAPYNGMTITWYLTPQVRSIDSEDHEFNIIIDGNNGTAEEIYEFTQYNLRQPTDIDDNGTVKIGKVTDELLQFLGDDLYTLSTVDGGVYIDNFNAADINRLVFTDNVGSGALYPYVATLDLNFGTNTIADAGARYWVYFTSTPSGSFGTSSGIIIDDALGDPISGLVGGQSTITHSFDYTHNVQGGRTENTDAPFNLVVIGSSGVQYAMVSGIIYMTHTNDISVIASIENAYETV